MQRLSAAGRRAAVEARRAGGRVRCDRRRWAWGARSGRGRLRAGRNDPRKKAPEGRNDTGVRVLRAGPPSSPAPACWPGPRRDPHEVHDDDERNPLLRNPTPAAAGRTVRSAHNPPPAPSAPSVGGSNEPETPSPRLRQRRRPFACPLCQRSRLTTTPCFDRPKSKRGCGDRSTRHIPLTCPCCRMRRRVTARPALAAIRVGSRSFMLVTQQR